MGAKIKNNSLRRLEKIHSIVTEIKGKGIYNGDPLDDIFKLSDINFKTRIRQSNTAMIKHESRLHQMVENEV